MNTGISTIVHYLRSYILYSKLWAVLFMMMLMGLIIYANYFHKNSFYILLHGQYGSVIRTFAGYYLLYLIPFALAFAVQYRQSKISFFSNKWFLFLLIIAPAIFALRINFDLHQIFLTQIWSGDTLLYFTKCIDWVVRVFVALIPVYIIWKWKDEKEMPFYGSKTPGSFRPYLFMLAIMIPLLLLAATQADFLRIYPRAQAIQNLSIPHDVFHYLFYELCYGFDFISIEFFFRGFLILSFLKICGKDCILPAACFYCCIHLGKPMGEAISSFFGGMILGIISYNTKSIWGGFAVHLGAAWMMELAGYVGYVWK